MSRPNLYHRELNWREHKGSRDCPTHPEAIVRMQLRCGRITNEARAGLFRWTHRNEPGDIMAYAVTEAPKDAGE